MTRATRTTPCEIRNSDFHQPLTGVLRDDLAELVGKTIGESFRLDRLQDDVQCPFRQIVVDGIAVANGNGLADAPIK